MLSLRQTDWQTDGKHWTWQYPSRLRGLKVKFDISTFPSSHLPCYSLVQSINQFHTVIRYVWQWPRTEQRRQEATQEVGFAENTGFHHTAGDLWKSGVMTMKTNQLRIHFQLMISQKLVHSVLQNSIHKFCIKHDSNTGMLCAKVHNDLMTEKHSNKPWN